MCDYKNIYKTSCLLKARKNYRIIKEDRYDKTVFVLQHRIRLFKIIPIWCDVKTFDKISGAMNRMSKKVRGSYRVRTILPT